MGNIRRFLIIPAFIFIVLAIGFGAFAVGKNSTGKTAQEEHCDSIGANHAVEIKGGRVKPDPVDAHICDELTIINRDKKLRLIAFGEHDNHIFYDGVEEKFLAENEELTVTLSKKGTYTFHDHLQEEVSGKFSVF